MHETRYHCNDGSLADSEIPDPGHLEGDKVGERDLTCREPTELTEQWAPHTWTWRHGEWGEWAGPVMITLHPTRHYTTATASVWGSHSRTEHGADKTSAVTDGDSCDRSGSTSPTWRSTPTSASGTSSSWTRSTWRSSPRIWKKGAARVVSLFSWMSYSSEWPTVDGSEGRVNSSDTYVACLTYSHGPQIANTRTKKIKKIT